MTPCQQQLLAVRCSCNSNTTADVGEVSVHTRGDAPAIITFVFVLWQMVLLTGIVALLFRASRDTFQLICP